MKKIYFISILILATIITSLLIYSNKKDTNLKVYSLVEAKGYTFYDNEDKTFTFELYSNLKDPLFTIPSNNSYILKLDSYNIKLDGVSCKTYKMNEGYIYKFSSILPKVEETNIYDDVILTIKNSTYTIKVNLGAISIYNASNVKLLNLDTYNGCYHKFNGISYLVGLTIKPCETFDETITSISVGGFARADLNKVVKGNYQDEVDIYSIIPNYQLTGSIINNKKIKLEYDDYFIPLIYSKISLIYSSYIEVKTTKNIYYYDTFPFKINTTLESDYKNHGQLGEITYA